MPISHDKGRPMPGRDIGAAPKAYVASGGVEEESAIREDTAVGPVGGLYIISVASRLLEMHPQTLRKYERAGFIRPSRTIGMLRLYSAEDIARLKLIKHLVDDLGMNLAGVEFVLGLLERLREAKERIYALEAERQMKDVVAEEFGKVLKLLDIAMGDLGLA